MQLAKFQEHIDNGGITFSVETTDDGYNQVLIKMNTSYYGYPDITSTLHIWSTGKYRSQKQILEDLGKMFIEASMKLEGK